MENPQEDLVYLKKHFSNEYTFLSKYLSSKKLLSFWLSPKMAGRSTYEGYLMELFPNKFKLISAGDIVRNWQTEIEKDPLKAKEKLEKLLPLDSNRAFVELKNSDVKKLVSEEIFLKLLKSQIQPGNQNIIIDGFPRTEKQVEEAIEIAQSIKDEYHPVALSLEVSDSVLNLRMESRRVCPNCGKVGNLLTLLNSEVKFDKKNKEFYLSCVYCKTQMVKKKTDTSIKDMLERREREKKVSKELVKRFKILGFLGLNIVTDTPATKFTGTDEQLNPAYKFNIDSKGEIIIKKVRQESVNEDGTKIYNYHPRHAVGLILKALHKNLQS